jgi:hypothetical protein
MIRMKNTSAVRVAMAMAGFFFSVSQMAHETMAQTASPKLEVKLAPHRAVYELSLARSKAGSNVSAMYGELQIEFTGSPCDGYVQTTTLTSSTADWNGRSIKSDVRSSSWEDGQGQRYRFHSSRFQDAQATDIVEGEAARDGDKKHIRVSLKNPSASKVRIAGDTMFPTQHSIAVIEAAMAGRFLLQANLYDGQDKGDKVYATTTVIGKALPPGANKSLKAVANAEKLDDVVSWPVNISYFEGEPQGDATPVYEIGFRMYANGVSRKIYIDYGSFAIEGELKSIEFLKPTECRPKR